MHWFNLSLSPLLVAFFLAMGNVSAIHFKFVHQLPVSVYIYMFTDSLQIGDIFIFYCTFYFLVFFIWTQISVVSSTPSTSRLFFVPLNCNCLTLMLMVGLERYGPSTQTLIFINFCNDIFVGSTITTKLFSPCHSMTMQFQQL